VSESLVEAPGTDPLGIGPHQLAAHRMRILVNSTDQGFCLCEMVLDEAGAAVDYRFLEVNALFEQMTGLADAVGRTALELLPDLERVWIETYARVALAGETLRFEQGSAVMGRWFDVFAIPVPPTGHFALVFRDETARRQAQQTLHENHRFVTDLTALVPGVLSVHDLDTARTAFVNREAAELLGHHPHGAAPEVDLVARAVHPDDVERYTGHRDEVARLPDGGSAAAELRLRDGTGAWRWYQVREVVLRRDAADRAVQSLAVATDITDRKAAEDTLRVRHERAELVSELLVDLERRTSAADRIQRLTELLVPVVADYATVEVPDEPQPLVGLSHRDPAGAATLRILRIAHRVPAEAANSVARAVAGEAQLLAVVPSAARDEYALDDETVGLLERLGPHSHMAVPLDLGGGRRAALLVGLSEPSRPAYGAEDLAFLQDTARRVAVVLAATRLRQEEHDVSVRLQRALLPDALVGTPDVVLEARYEAAGSLLQVGGDWYDSFAWPDGQIGLMVGDVVGHDLDSTATMGRLRAATAALAGQLPPSPAALLDALERFARGPDGTDYATAVCVVLDPATGRLTWSSAGHPPVVVVRPDGGTVLLTAATAPPLCVEADPSRTEASMTLEPDTLVVLYSDGLVERRGEHLDAGIARLEAVAAAHDHEPVATVADRLVAAMAEHSPPEDDVVVACLRWSPARGRFDRSLPAAADRLGPLRADLRGWLDGRGVPPDARDDVVLAVHEAVSAAAVDADPASTVDVEVTDHGRHLAVRVRDRGGWRPAGRDPREGGLGTALLTAVATRLRHEVGPAGSTVTFTVQAPGRAGHGDGPVPRT
jgi:serine phosphatase RsbU (regulator of sigma subunit)/PAS domain-containing protein/anti-sigma regulatory factor (Ser/Thr protein kinase)